MLLRFGVENHLSIRERQELLLTAAKRVKRSDPAVPVPILKEEAVPLAVLYGRTLPARPISSTPFGGCVGTS